MDGTVSSVLSKNCCKNNQMKKVQQMSQSTKVKVLIIHFQPFLSFTLLLAPISLILFLSFALSPFHSLFLYLARYLSLSHLCFLSISLSCPLSLSHLSFLSISLSLETCTLAEINNPERTPVSLFKVTQPSFWSQYYQSLI